ncbi:MAG: hypothetical protein ACLU0O_11945 [Collinsella sp.]
MDGDDHSIDDEEEVAAQAGGQEGVAQAEEPQAVDSERGYRRFSPSRRLASRSLRGKWPRLPRAPRWRTPCATKSSR